MAKGAAPKKTSSSPLFTKGAVTGFTRSLANQNHNQSILKLDGVQDIAATKYYLGKKVAYVYSTKKASRVIWGKITKSHGNTGSVRAIFKSNLPGKALGKTVRVMLFPQA